MRKLVLGKQKMLMLPIIMGLMACSSMNIVNSLEEKKGSDFPFRYYDSESQIAYAITNDDVNLHLRLRIKDEANMVKILKSGLTIYFDVMGKKKTDVFVKYPIAHTGEAPKTERNEKQKGLENKRKKLETMISVTPVLATYQSFEDVQQFSVINADSEFKCGLRLNENEELIYDLVIPMHKISENGRIGLSNLSIGVESGILEIRERPNNGGGSSNGGGPPSGGRGGGGGGGPSGDRGANGGEDRSDQGKKIAFWFKVLLFS